MYLWKSVCPWKSVYPWKCVGGYPLEYTRGSAWDSCACKGYRWVDLPWGWVAWGVGRGYLDLGGDGGNGAAVSSRLLAVFGPLFSAGIFYWAVSGLAGVDSAKAILGIFRRKRPE